MCVRANKVPHQLQCPYRSGILILKCCQWCNIGDLVLGQQRSLPLAAGPLISLFHTGRIEFVSRFIYTPIPAYLRLWWRMWLESSPPIALVSTSASPFVFLACKAESWFYKLASLSFNMIILGTLSWYVDDNDVHVRMLMYSRCECVLWKNTNG